MRCDALVAGRGSVGGSAIGNGALRRIVRAVALALALVGCGPAAAPLAQGGAEPVAEVAARSTATPPATVSEGTSADASVSASPAASPVLSPSPSGSAAATAAAEKNAEPTASPATSSSPTPQTANPTATPLRTANPTPTPLRTANPTPSASPSPRVAAAVASLDSAESELVQLINAFRAQRGLPQLAVSGRLTSAAKWMSTDMSVYNYFSHTSRDGRAPVQRMADAGYPVTGTWTGENLAAGYTSAREVLNGWINSPAHLAVLTNPAYRAIGVGRAWGAGSSYGTYWTMDVGGVIDVATNAPGFDV
jgi:uncharacterized protein YkwD